jgi:UDP-N-acetylmuramate dehydrogenase
MADKSEIQEVLGDIAFGKILYDEPMSRYASLCVGGNADALVFVESEKELIQIVRRLKERKINFIPVGNLTNVIVRDGGYRGAILLMKGLREINCKSTQESDYCIWAQSGATLSMLVNLPRLRNLRGWNFVRVFRAVSAALFG